MMRQGNVMKVSRLLGWSEPRMLTSTDLQALRALEQDANVMGQRRDEEHRRLRKRRAPLDAIKRKAASRSLLFLGLNAIAGVMIASLYAAAVGEVRFEAEGDELLSAGWTELREWRTSPGIGDGWLFGAIAGFVLTALWSLRSESSDGLRSRTIRAEAVVEQVETTVQVFLLAASVMALLLAVPAAAGSSWPTTVISLALAWVSVLVSWHLNWPRSARWGYAELVESEGRFARARIRVIERQVAACGTPDEPLGCRGWVKLSLEVAAWSAASGVIGLVITDQVAAFAISAATMNLTVAILMPILIHVATPDRWGNPSTTVLAVGSFLLAPYMVAWPVLAWILWGVSWEAVLLSFGLGASVVYALGRYRWLRPRLELGVLRRAAEESQNESVSSRCTVCLPEMGTEPRDIRTAAN